MQTQTSLCCQPRRPGNHSENKKRETQRLSGLTFYIYSPAMHRYMIYSVSSNNLSLYFCQCTVLLKPVYIQPHDNAWLLTLKSFFKCCPNDFPKMTRLKLLLMMINLMMVTIIIYTTIIVQFSWSPHRVHAIQSLLRKST